MANATITLQINTNVDLVAFILSLLAGSAGQSVSVSTPEGCEACDTPCGEQSLEGKIDELLSDTRYEYRTLATLEEKTGAAYEDISALVSNSSKYQIKRRRSDGAALVKLINSAAAIPEPVDTFEDDLIGLLDGEHDLRTVSKLAEKLGKTEEFILDFVSDDDDYVVKTRRRDGAKLVGLASRN